MNLCIAIGCEHAPGEGGVEQDGARWQPVTQSARSRQSYGKIGDCEQPRVKFQAKVRNAAYLGHGLTQSVLKFAHPVSLHFLTFFAYCTNL